MNQAFRIPWRTAGPTTGIPDLFVEDDSGVVVARIGRDAPPETRKLWRDLIAAAPDLYTVLEELVEHGLSEDQLYYLINQETAAKARAALAKYDTLQSTPVPTDDDPNPPKCKSCEKPWRQHLGAEGLCKQVQELKQAVRTLRSYADDTVDYWAEGRIKKVGKRLMAMSGHNPGYSASIDAALATESGENYD